jgi:6-phosphofructokinase 1
MALGILTSGGDAPGMNAAIVQAWLTCRTRAIPVLAVRRGFRGLLEGESSELGERELLLHGRLAGTMLGTSRLPSFAERVEDVAAACSRQGLSGLLVIGGHGSMRAAGMLAERGVAVVAIPGTIDHDIPGCDETIGFDSALAFAAAALDGVRATAEAMPRVFGVETLGGSTGYLASAVAVAGFADLALVPEHPVAASVIEARLRERLRQIGHAVVVGGEGYARLHETLEQCATRAGSELRYTKLGHAQRGATPSGRDRCLARTLAAEAVLALEANHACAVVARRGHAARVPFAEVAADKPPPPPLIDGVADTCSATRRGA